VTDVPDDPLADLIRKLETMKRELESLESPLARRIRTGGHEVQQALASELGVATEELDGGFLDDPPEPETPLLRRLRTGV